MLTDPIPTEYFTDIAYNSQFYNQNNWVTLPVGDERYLKRIVGNHTSNATSTSFINSVNVGGLNSTGSITGPLISASSISNTGDYVGSYLNLNNSTISAGYQAGQTNQGLKSVAIGYQAGQTNQGDYSVCVGFNTQSSGDYSLALGTNAIATGSHNISVGTSLETINLNGSQTTANILNSTTINNSVKPFDAVANTTGELSAFNDSTNWFTSNFSNI